MESKKGTSFFSNVISTISIFMLVFWNSFFVYAENLAEINNSSEKVKMLWEAHDDIFADAHDHDHETISVSSWLIDSLKISNWEEIEIEWI